MAKVNVNTGTREELVDVAGLRPELADAIVKFRGKHGSITSADVLEEVPGVGSATLEQLLHMRRTANELFGAGAYTWSAAGVGYPGEFHLAATALMLGGHVRVGLER